MEEQVSMQVIAHIRSDFPSKFGIPRQSGLVDALEAEVVFAAPYRDANALRGLEDFSHIWLIWQFSQAVREDWSPTVRPPRLGGNTRMGVFATRSPFRPNALGLSCVRLLGIEDTEEGRTLRVAGADLMDGTPIFDIKPYIPYADCKPEAESGFAPDPGAQLTVEFLPEAEKHIPPEKRQALRGVLANDPRPRYKQDGERVYALEFAGREVKFQVKDKVLRVLSAEAL